MDPEVARKNTIALERADSARPARMMAPGIGPDELGDVLVGDNGIAGHFLVRDESAFT
jgi:hypothetical protein